MGIHWFIFIALIFIIIQGFLFNKFGQKGLSYQRFFSTKACFTGDEIEMVERISNWKLLPIPWLRLESLIQAGLKFHGQFNLEIIDGKYFQYHKSFFSLLPYNQITRRHKITCLKRGCYRLNSAAVTLGDVLGLNTTRANFTLDAELLVYPKLVTIAEINLPSHSWQGDFTVRRWIVNDPFMISGVREYRYGDPLNGINWKATARNGGLQVHQRDFTADHRMMIYLNVEDDELMWDEVNDEDLIEQGIVYAAAIARHVIQQGMEIGFGTNAHMIDSPKEPIRVEPKCGSDQMTYLLETMARLVVARSIPFYTFLEQEVAYAAANMDILIVSTYMNDKMAELIEQLRSNGNGVDFIQLDKKFGTEQAGAGA